METFRFLVPGRLAFLSAEANTIEQHIASSECSEMRFISSNLHKQYLPFANDFGPVNLAVLHRFCKGFSERLAKKDSTVWVYCFGKSCEEQANASFLLGGFMMLEFGWTPQQASTPFFSPLAPFKLRPFCDASVSFSNFGLSLLDCFEGLATAVSLGWFNMATFDAKAYSDLDNPQNGDMHQICPKFVAFKGPLSADSKHRQPKEVALTPDECIPALCKLGVTDVVRLNDADTYDAEAFAAADITHHDLFFPDCTAPPDALVCRFLDLCDAAAGPLAVHCRAGLGRTGTLIALWLMRRHGFSARGAMGWLRIVRPGCVIGPQQAFLLACERRCWCGNTLLPPLAPVSFPVAASGGFSVPRCFEQASFPQLACGGLSTDCGEEEEAAAAQELEAEDLAAGVLAGMCARGASKLEALASRGQVAAPMAAAGVAASRTRGRDLVRAAANKPGITCGLSSG